MINLIRSFVAPSVDAAVAGLSKAARKLNKAQDHHLSEAARHAEAASVHHDTHFLHMVEHRRAVRIGEKITALISE